MAMMGKDVHILKPKKTAASYRDYLKTLAKEYKGVQKGKQHEKKSSMYVTGSASDGNIAYRMW